MPRTRTRPATADPAAIRAVLRARVAADGRTQAEIGRAAGVAQPNLSRLLAGDRDPAISTVGRLLAALGLPWSALDGGPGPG